MLAGSPRETARSLVVACAIAALAACEPARLPELVVGGDTMGTTWSVKVVLDRAPDDALRRSVMEAAERNFAIVDHTMSTYRDDSDVSRFNRAPANVRVPLADPLLEVLLLSRRVSEETDGAFDVTVGPLVEAWGFGPAAGAAPDPPGDEELERLRATIGYRLLEVDLAGGAAIKLAEGVRVDLNAVAPGYAVDRIAEELERLGHTRYLVDVGGEMRAGGLNAEGAPWRIAIEKPALGRSIQRVLPLRDAALATSGDYRNFYERDGRRYSHVIDPRTLEPVRHSVGSATVVHPSAAEADALATALLVAGEESALELAERRNLPVLLLVYDGREVVERRSSAMDRFLGETATSTARSGAS